MSNNNFINIPVRAAAILDNNYVTHTILDQTGAANFAVNAYNQLTWYCYYTKGSLTSVQFLLEKSVDGVHWVPEDTATVSGGTITLAKGTYTTTEDGNLAIAIPISARFARISVKGTGTVTDSSMQIDAYLQYI